MEGKTPSGNISGKRCRPISKESLSTLTEFGGVAMVKPTIIETGEGIQRDFDVMIYDRMMRRMRGE